MRPRIPAHLLSSLLMLAVPLLGVGCSLGSSNGSDGSAGDDAPGGDGPGGPDDDGGGGDGGGAAGVACSAITGVTGVASVLECVPEGMEGATGAPKPLVVALHGYTQTAAAYKDTTEWHLLAARYGFYVVFPQTSPDIVGAGGKPAAWKWWRDYAAWTRTSFNPHYKPIIAAVDKMKALHNIDPDRVFITGLSAGGYMTTLMLAVYPDVFAAGASFSGGAHNCDLKCTDSNKIQDWTRPVGYRAPTAADVINAYPQHWNDATTRKPRLLVVHGGLDQAVKPINLDDAMTQWTGALGIDKTPDNATLGEPTTLGAYAYKAYAYNGTVGVGTVLMSNLGHGSPVKPGSGVDEGGNDPVPSQVASECAAGDTSCTNDWTNSGDVYGAYVAARFFGLAP